MFSLLSAKLAGRSISLSDWLFVLVSPYLSYLFSTNAMFILVWNSGMAALLLILTSLLVLFSMPPLAALLPLTYLNLNCCLTLAGLLYLGVVEDSSWCISGSWRMVLDLLRCQLDYRRMSRNVAPIIYAPLILLKFLSAPPLHVCLLLCHHLVFFWILYPLLSSLSNRLLLFLVSWIVFFL